MKSFFEGIQFLFVDVLFKPLDFLRSLELSTWFGANTINWIFMIVCIVDWAKKKLIGLELIDANAVLAEINPNLHLNHNRKTAQLWPHIHQTDAMFIALFTKTSG